MTGIALLVKSQARLYDVKSATTSYREHSYFQLQSLPSLAARVAHLCIKVVLLLAIVWSMKQNVSNQWTPGILPSIRGT
jgi:protein-S-isoprenylcysteine O-methyltransferase Ste14